MIIQEFKNFSSFLFRILFAFSHPLKIRWSMAVIESLRMIRQSIPIVLISGVFVGGIITIIFERQLSTLRAHSILGALTSSATMREVAPLLIAFMLAGKCGAYVSSEISSMKATDQLDSLRILGLSDFRLIIIPRIIGIFVAVMFTLFIGIFSSICGCILLAYGMFNIHPYQYFVKFDWLVNWSTLGAGFYKCFMFGTTMSVISCYAGYRSEKTSVGVGKAVQYAAVCNMLAIIFLDSFTTHTYDWFLNFILRARDLL